MAGISQTPSINLFLFLFMRRANAQRHSIHGMMEEENVIRPHQEIQALTIEEKKFLLSVERGDVAGTRRLVMRMVHMPHRRYIIDLSDVSTMTSLVKRLFAFEYTRLQLLLFRMFAHVCYMSEHTFAYICTP